MEVDTGQFRAIQAEALEVSALRRNLIWLEGSVGLIEQLAEDRGFKRGVAAGRHARPRGGRHTHLYLVATGEAAQG
jgi:hypothetical protein